MSCDRLVGGRFIPGRLVFDGVPTAVEDNCLIEITSVAGGVVQGRFRDPATDNPLADTFTHGTCTPTGQRARLTFTRNHAAGGVVTVYTGTVIIVSATATVLIRQGRFTRTSPDANLALNTTQGDWETEKPT